MPTTNKRKTSLTVAAILAASFCLYSCIGADGILTRSAVEEPEGEAERGVIRSPEPGALPNSHHAKATSLAVALPCAQKSQDGLGSAWTELATIEFPKPAECCDYDRQELDALLDACSAYHDSINEHIRTQSTWPDQKNYLLISNTFNTCRKARNTLRATIGNSKEVARHRSLYMQVVDDFKESRWSALLAKMQDGYPLELNDGREEPGYPKNIMQLAALYSAPPEVMKRIMATGVAIPDYTIPLALKHGNVAVYEAFSKKNKNINSISFHGAPYWAPSFFSGKNDAYGAMLLERGADYSVKYMDNGEYGDILHHFLRSRALASNPAYGRAAVLSMIAGGARVERSMLDMDVPIEVRDLLVTHFAKCGDQ